MIDGKSVLGVIVARGGSKRLPGKNLMMLKGKPLVTWSVETALNTRTLDRTIISSDDPAIMDCARAAGCEVPFQRPQHLSADDSTASAVMEHALDSLSADPDYAVLLQATSPLRTAEDIDFCVQLCHEKGAPACVSVSELEKPLSWVVTLDNNKLVHPYFNATATSAPAYIPNGAVYVIRVDAFRASKSFYPDAAVGYIMPRERSIDIDVSIDLEVARAILTKTKHTTNGQ